MSSVCPTFGPVPVAGLPWEGECAREGSAPAAWSPASLSPEGWWRADLGHVAADAAGVSSWTNQGSESTLDLAQGTGTSQPTYDEVNAGFNGQASLHFDGGDVLPSVATDAWEVADGGSICIIAVVRADTSANHCFVATDDAGNGGFQFRIRTTGSSSKVRWEGASGTVVEPAIGGGHSTATTYVMAAVLKGEVSPTVDTAEYWVDGVNGSTKTGDMAGIIPNGGTGTEEFVAGSNSDSSGDFTGDMAELIYVRRVFTAPEDAELVTYLNDRYGLSLTGVTL